MIIILGQYFPILVSISVNMRSALAEGKETRKYMWKREDGKEGEKERTVLKEIPCSVILIIMWLDYFR